MIHMRDCLSLFHDAVCGRGQALAWSLFATRSVKEGQDPIRLVPYNSQMC